MNEYFERVRAYNLSVITDYFADNFDRSALFYRKTIESVTGNDWLLFAHRLHNQSREQLTRMGRPRDGMYGADAVSFARFIGIHWLESVMHQRQSFWER